METADAPTPDSTPPAEPATPAPDPPTPTLAAAAQPTTTPTARSATPTPARTRVPTTFDPSRFIGQGNAYECTDFASQAEAQAVLRLDPTDPNVIDRNGDGVACEDNPPPRDTRRVARPAQ